MEWRVHLLEIVLVIVIGDAVTFLNLNVSFETY